MTIIYTLLVAHFVADFLCQSDWMALNKSKRWDALSLHVAAYMLAMAGVVGLLTGGVHTRPDALVAWVVVNGIAHFVQDAITSRINSRLWQANQRHWFFVGIGFDQLLHYVTLFVTAGWWLR